MIRLRSLRFTVVLLASLVSASHLRASPKGLADFDRPRQILVMVKEPPEHFRPGGSYGNAYGSPVQQSGRERLAREIARRYGLAFSDAWPMPMISKDCFVLTVPISESASDAAEKVSRDRSVEWAEPVSLFKAQGAERTHNDPLYLAQPAARLWHLAELHQLAVGRGIKIAVVDSGIDVNHPDLRGQVAVNRNFVVGEGTVAENHGTAVAGIIAAKADNGIGIAGIAPGAQLMGLRACSQVAGSHPQVTQCDSFSLAKALYFAVEHRAQVINLSLSGPEDRLLRELVNLAIARGQTVVGAVDQESADGGFQGHSEACRDQ